MNSERTLETVISASTLKDIMHSSLAQFMTAAGFIKEDEDLTEFDFDTISKGGNVKVKFKIKKEKPDCNVEVETIN